MKQARTITEEEYHKVLGELNYISSSLEEQREELAKLVNRVYALNEILADDEGS